MIQDLERQALIAQLGDSPLPSRSGTGNTGIGGVPDQSQLAGAEPSPKPPGSSHYSYTSGGVTTSGDVPNDVSPEGVAKLNAEHPEFAGGQPLPTESPESPTTPAKTYNTRLMEGDPSKFTPEHEAGSPKYDFLNLARSNKYDYTQMPEMLKELQGGPNGRLWQGWTADGKGNFVFTGDPKQLAPEWNGVTHVDAVGAFGNLSQGKEAGGWRWGVDEGGQGSTPGQSGGPIPQNGMIPGSAGDMSGDDLLTSLNQGVPTDNTFFQKLLDQLRAQAGPQSTDRAAMLAQMQQ